MANLSHKPGLPDRLWTLPREGPKIPGLTDSKKFVYPPKWRVQESLEALIHHFHLASEGFPVPPGEVYASIESPKGELGFYLVSNGSNKPWRLRVRPPSFINLSALSKMVQGHLVADVVAIIGSIDIVLAEVDR